MFWLSTFFYCGFVQEKEERESKKKGRKEKEKLHFCFKKEKGRKNVRNKSKNPRCKFSWNVNSGVLKVKRSGGGKRKVPKIVPGKK